MKNLLSRVANYISDVLAFFSELFGWLPTKRGDRFLREGGGDSDLIGVKAPVSQDITRVDGKVRYSGIDWSARLDRASPVEIIPIGIMVQIVAVDGNVLIVSCEVLL